MITVKTPEDFNKLLNEIDNFDKLRASPTYQNFIHNREVEAKLDKRAYDDEARVKLRADCHNETAKDLPQTIPLNPQLAYYFAAEEMAFEEAHRRIGNELGIRRNLAGLLFSGFHALLAPSFHSIVSLGKTWVENHEIGTSFAEQIKEFEDNRKEIATRILSHYQLKKNPDGEYILERGVYKAQYDIKQVGNWPVATTVVVLKNTGISKDLNLKDLKSDIDKTQGSQIN